MSTTEWSPAEGGCPCKTIRYRLDRSPLIVHCCHCTWCQKDSGSAFNINAMVETKYVVTLSTVKPIIVPVPTESGAGQNVARCPTCMFMVWSNYGDPEDIVRSIRVGTLDDPSRAPPDIHIFTMHKQPWLSLDDGLPNYDEYYKREEVWSRASLERRDVYIKSMTQ